MAARIQSLRNGINPIDELSRNDLVVGDVVTVTSLDAASTYNWAIAFAPEGSAATFSGSATAVSPGTFTVDLVGPYLIKLTVDVGLASEDTQYVRLRALTVTLGLQLVAAGERRDGTGIIPVDVDPEGWANEQNSNLQALETFLAEQTLSLTQQTTDAAPNIAMVESIPIQDEVAYAFQAMVTAWDTTLNQASYFRVEGLATRFGGGVAFLVGVGATPVQDQIGGTIAATANVNGNNLEIQVTGVALKTIRWHARVMMSEVGGV
jgi:hypothetical protein